MADRARSIEARPICDRCNKPVERMTEEHDDFCDRMIFVAECHGERERVEVTADELAYHESIQFGRAFIQPLALQGATRGR